MKKIKKEKWLELTNMWLHNLVNYPERQMKNALGEGTMDNYKACCLGEALICIHRQAGTKAFDGRSNVLRSSPKAQAALHQTQVDILRLRSIAGDVSLPGKLADSDSLTEMNDDGKSWVEIAKFIYKNPFRVFKDLPEDWTKDFLEKNAYLFNTDS